MQISPILWLAAAVGFLALEASTFNMTSIWFAIGSAAALLCCVFTGSFRVQAVVFLAVSLAALLAAKKLLKSRFNRARQPTNADRILGETVIVTEEINNEKPSGQIRAGSIFWTARSIDGTVIPKDAEVTVKYIDGVKAMVERA